MLTLQTVNKAFKNEEFKRLNNLEFSIFSGSNHTSRIAYITEDNKHYAVLYTLDSEYVPRNVEIFDENGDAFKMDLFDGAVSSF